MDKPVLYFSLLGRKASGKSCLFTSLNAPREVNPKHITCSFAEEANQFKRVVSTLRKEKFLNKQDNLQRDKMSNNLKENVEKIKNGEKLDSTGLPERYVYVFSLNTEDKFGTDLALLDYAGELLNNKGETNEYFNSLLKKMDSIFALVGIPKGEKEEQEFNDEINKLTTAFKAIDIKRKDKSLLLNIPIVLMVSKFDRYITDNNLDFSKIEECEKSFYSSRFYKSLEPLIQTIKNITDEGMFEVFLTSAFGECTENDIPKNREMLKPINLLEPFEWAARKVADLKLKECEDNYNKYCFPTSIFHFNKYYDQAEEILPIFPENSEKRKKLSVLDSNFKSQKTLRNFSFFTALIFVLLSIDCYSDYTFLQELEVESTTVNACQERIEKLRVYKNSDFYRHFIARFSFLTNENCDEKISLLEKAINVKEIEEIKNEKDIDSRIDKSNKLLAENSTRANAEEIKVIRNSALAEKWQTLATNFKNDLLKKSSSSNVATEKEINDFSDRLNELEKESNDSQKATIKTLKSFFADFKLDNSKKNWEQKAVEVEKEISVLRNSAGAVDEDKDLAIRNSIALLNTNYSESFDNDGIIKDRLSNIEKDYKNLIREKRLNSWEKIAIEIEKSISVLRNSSDDILEEEDISIRNNISLLKNSYSEYFDIEGKSQERLNRIENDYESLIIEKNLKTWEKTVNAFVNELNNYKNTKTAISDGKYNEFNKKLKLIKNDYQEIFKKKEVINNLEEELKSIYQESKSREWHNNVSKLENEIKKVESSNEVLSKDNYEELLKKITEQDRLYESFFNSPEIIKNLKARVEKVYLEGQKKSWREKAAKFENKLNSCKMMDNLEEARRKINSLNSDLQEMGIEVSKNKNWELDNEMSELKINYFKIKNENSIKLFRKTFQDKIHEADNLSTSDDVKDLANSFKELLDLKEYIDGMENEIPAYVFVEYAKNYWDSFKNIKDKSIDSLDKRIKLQNDSNNYDESRKDLMMIFKNESYVKIMKEIKQEKVLEEGYENRIKNIELEEFVYDYNQLCKISEQGYREVFDSENKTKLNSFISKYSKTSREDFQQYIKDVKKLYDYLNIGKATLLVEIKDWSYPSTFNLDGGSKTLFIEAYPYDGKGWEYSEYYKGNKSLIKFSVNSIGWIQLKATCYGTYDNYGPFNTSLTYSGTGTFDSSGNCSITMTLKTNSSDKTYNDAYGKLNAKVIGLADLPELTPLYIK